MRRKFYFFLGPLAMVFMRTAFNVELVGRQPITCGEGPNKVENKGAYNVI